MLRFTPPGRIGASTLNAKSKRQRCSSGQAIAESAVGLILLLAIGIPLVLLLINVGVFFYWGWKLNVVATDAARYISAAKFEGGLPNPDFDPAIAKQEARDLADQELAVLGLSKTTQFDVSEKQIKVGGKDDTLTRVVLGTGQFLSFGGFLKNNPLAVLGVGVSHDRQFMTSSGKGSLELELGSALGRDGLRHQYQVIVPVIGHSVISAAKINSDINGGGLKLPQTDSDPIATIQIGFPLSPNIVYSQLRTTPDASPGGTGRK